MEGKPPASRRVTLFVRVSVDRVTLLSREDDSDTEEFEKRAGSSAQVSTQSHQIITVDRARFFLPPRGVYRGAYRSGALTTGIAIQGSSFT